MTTYNPDRLSIITFGPQISDGSLGFRQSSWDWDNVHEDIVAHAGKAIENPSVRILDMNCVVDAHRTDDAGEHFILLYEEKPLFQYVLMREFGTEDAERLWRKTVSFIGTLYDQPNLECDLRPKSDPWLLAWSIARESTIADVYGGGKIPVLAPGFASTAIAWAMIRSEAA